MLLRPILVVLLALSAAPRQDAPLLVSAAISLTEAVEAVAAAYEAAGGGSVRFNFAASNVLARQIANGARADVFLSADEAQMDYAARHGAIDPASRRPLLGNRLAIVVRAEGRARLTDARGLLDPALRRVAVADPAAVPAGVYARAYLEHAGLWHALQPKLLALGNVRAALTAVESGGADAAIVYRSDAAASPAVTLAYVFGAGEGPAIRYPVAITRRTRHRAAAERFVTFLQGDRARAIFARFGFDPLEGAAHD